MKKTLAIVLALVMILSLATAVMADNVPTGGKITITNAAVGESYTIVKLFDASVSKATDSEGNEITNVVYTGSIPDALQTYFVADTAGYITATAAAKNDSGELSEDAIAAIKAWAANQSGTTKVATATTLEFDNLTYGYYVVTTTQGTVISVDSTTPTVEIKDKNTAPSVDKEITGASDISEDGESAIAQLGETITYESTITVGTGAKNYVYHDTMESGLTFNNNSVTVTLNGTLVDASNYEVQTNVKHSDTVTHTFDVDFTDTFEATLKVNDKIVISYRAVVNSDALTTDPANNNASLTYGNKGETTTDSTNVYTAKFTVTKQDGNNKALAGAGFVLSKSETEEIDDGNGGTTTSTVTKYYKLENGVVSWVNDIEDATEYTSDANGAVSAFTGLTSGTYKLIENTVPAGYNKAADFTFTIKNDNYEQSNLEQSTTVINNAGTELPTTGGIGTTLFYIFGGILVVGAVVLLVTKKRMNAA